MCTNITVKYKAGVIAARTNEFGIIINSNLFTMPRGVTQRGFCTKEDMGLSWSNKYGFVGVDSNEIMAKAKIALDGINEKGLSVQGLYFPNYADYEETSDYDNCITNLTFVNFVLGCFQSVDEVKMGLKKVHICGESLKKDPEPFHFQVNDANGGCIVVEIENKQVKIYDNDIGVMTNSPSFGFHETNYKNYINLSPYNFEKINFDGTILYQTGQGSGQLGMPGDMTPPSRFIKAAFNQLCAISPDTSEEAVDLAFRILNSFDIVPGTVRHRADKAEIEKIPKELILLSDKNDICELTQSFIVKDLNNFKIYYKDYFNANIKMIDCNLFDFSEGAKSIMYKIYNDIVPKYIDITSECIKTSK